MNLYLEMFGYIVKMCLIKLDNIICIINNLVIRLKKKRVYMH